MKLALLPLAVFGFVPVASASPSFPAVVESEAEMPCTPSCALCHETAVGGSGTAGQEFAFSMLAAGLIEADDATVGPALTTIGESDSDLDADGVGDLDELRFGTNPTPDGTDFRAVPIPQYGCFGGENMAWMGGLLGFLGFRNRRLVT